ncbi:hypothetical protein [Halorubrum lacusprofundi]|uniref:ABC-2 type transport system permease protein n=1 Tax=Halorubrum lacusprofundi (strain ATCC 49239 / DSM 5036 / JCM 8891 / ACAM 34) TaxID=416348 RepID=B9LWA0_HALLT|nr:hypothetical protein [Halorubrum lacusprofundi]ACM58490.1 conserved hypothetical protein [Halorubrum lacusprofundi ATCC 49239]MCG1008296.1 hypothetical protein [Halorubrum lacusprofundi]
MTRAKRLRLIARAELRRRWRTMKGNTTQLLALAFAGIMLLPFSIGGVFGAYLAGGFVAGSETEPLIEWARVAFVYGWIFVVGFGGYRAYAVALRPDNLDGLLTAVSHRDLISGLLLTELALWSAFFLTVGSAASVAFAVGAGSLLTIPALLLTLCLLLATGIPAGFIIALGVRNAGVRSRLLSRLRTLFLVLLGIGYFALIFTNAFASALEPIYRVLSPTPIDWFGDLAALGLGVGASPFRAIGAVGFTGVFVVVAVVSLYRLSEWLWYADGVHITHEVERSDDRSSRFNGLSRILSQPVFGVVVADWKRARRSPISLSFALYPLIVLAGPIVTAVQTGEIGTGLPLWVLLTGTWVAGSLFALNVVGQEGAALPVTLLSEAPERSLVTGHVLSGALLIAPITVAATVTAGILSPHSVPVVASLGVSALVLSAVSGAIGTGIGVGLPRFEAVSVSRSTKAIVPSAFAFAIYSVAVLIVALPAVIAHSGIAGHALASAVGVNRFVIGLSGTLVSAVFACLVGIVSMYVARDRVRNYRLG